MSLKGFDIEGVAHLVACIFSVVKKDKSRLARRYAHDNRLRPDQHAEPVFLEADLVLGTRTLYFGSISICLAFLYI
jgi:hypothetical protein